MCTCVLVHMYIMIILAACAYVAIDGVHMHLRAHTYFVNKKSSPIYTSYVCMCTFVSVYMST